MYWPASGVYSQSPAGSLGRDAFRVALDRYADPASYPADLHVVRRFTATQPAGGDLHYIVLRGRGPASGLTREYWVQEEHHLVVFEQIRDWAGHVAANLTWKQQTLNLTLAPASFAFAPPQGTIRTAGSLGLPEPRCGNAFPYPATPTEITPADFTLPDQNGREVRFEKSKGPVVLTFWHTWLPVAVLQLQALEKFQESRRVRGVEVLGYTDEPPEVVKEFLRKNGLTSRTLIDPDHSVQ
ncbi:hypothetical protein SBA3_1920029 [Candidatus Sulfopaludibacter sp. SbA3]|nr:hypothetical protein SBA3_1920029 [Candidatus Sulfopaludibacter sp. SbA3]